MKFSIITAAFNESERIEKCIQSVLNQTFDDFEILVVDDGSEDDTAKKVESFTKIDKRVNLIRMEKNVGLTAAKNVALADVKGEYLVFVDADDWILPEMLSDLKKQLDSFNNVDMFRLKGRKVYSRDEEPEPGHKFETHLYTPVNLIREKKMSGYMHNLVVKNDLVQKHKIRFTPGAYLLEDQEFTMTCMVYSTNVLYFTKRNYMYYQHPGSLSKNEKTEQLPDILNCAMNVYQHAQKHLSDNDLNYFRKYSLWKCDQFLKRVLKDKNFENDKVQDHMDKFFTVVDLPIHQRLFQTAKYRAVRVAKYIGM